MDQRKSYEKDHNPLDDFWPAMYGYLQAKDGVWVRNRLWEVREISRPLSLGLIARVDKWIGSYLSRDGLTEEETGMGFTPLSAGRARLATYLWNLGIRGKSWSPSDLPRIISGMDAEVHRVMSVDHSDWRENNVACVNAFKELVTGVVNHGKQNAK